MPPVFHIVLVLLALVCFALSIFRTGLPDWSKLVSAGLTFLVASMISW